MAEAVRQVCPNVVFAYSVIPAAPILDQINLFAANGTLDAEVVNAESSQSALNGCIGASAAGGRTFTATASQGLAQMHETLFVSSALRLPLVLGVTNRALASPPNLHADHTDTLAERDCGWIQFYCETPQEVYDNIIQAYRIAEHDSVRTPVMVTMDAWTTSHSLGNIFIEEKEEIDKFVGKWDPMYSLLKNNRLLTMGSHAMPEYYFEHKYNQAQGIENARHIIKEVGIEFGHRFGRYYSHFETYEWEDAQFGIIVMNSTAGTVKETIDQLRNQGEKIGALKLRVFRPFPAQELCDALSGLKAIAVLERSLVPGTNGGPLTNEIRSALYDNGKPGKPSVIPYIYGLGGRPIDVKDIEDIVKEIKKESEKAEKNSEARYIHLRQ